MQRETKRRCAEWRAEGGELCCSCTRYSTCQTNNCECVKAQRKCRRCQCHRQCVNQPVVESWIEDSETCLLTNADAAVTEATPCDEEETGSPANRPPLLAICAPARVPTGVSEEDGSRDEYGGEDEVDPPLTQPPTPALTSEQKLASVYGEQIHQNDGSHLDGGVKDDTTWQEHWTAVMSLPPQRYDVPSGRVGRVFVSAVAKELEGVKLRLWNAERFIVMQAVILQRSPEVKRARDIRRRVETRLAQWREGKFTMLVEDTVRTSRGLITRLKRGMTEEAVAKTFTAMVLKGKIRAAVRFATLRGEGGVLNGSDIDKKSGTRVLDVLHSKHPEAVIPDAAVLEEYAVVPAMKDLDVTCDTVTKVAGELSGAGGPGGVDAVALQHWLLRFGKDSFALREAVAEFTRWMANSTPPWAAIRAIMANRLMALDKCPGVRPVGIGEIWRRLFSKCVLKEAGAEATEACGSDQLCAGLKADIEGAVHAVRAMAAIRPDEEEWGFLLVDAANAFNAGNRTAILWTVRHLWPSGARFSFNCYRHWSSLMIRRDDGYEADFLMSKEGVTQGDPLSMILYGIGMLPLTKLLKKEIPDCIQPWYADDAGAGGSFEAIEDFFNLLVEEGPARGYFPEPTKSILVVKPQLVEAAKLRFEPLGFKISTGDRYLGGFLGDSTSQGAYIDKKVEGWVDGIARLSRIAISSPQCAFIALQKSYQQEWQHLQRVVNDISAHFLPVEHALQTKFLPALLGGITPTDIPPDLRTILSLPVKLAGIGVPLPTTTADDRHLSSSRCTAVLVDSLIDDSPLCMGDHLAAMSEGRVKSRTSGTATAALSLEGVMQGMDPHTKRRTLRNKESGAWISIQPTYINGLTLSKDEWRDGMRMRYGLELQHLQKKCDGCGCKFTIEHALKCKKGGLVVGRHNEVRDVAGSLAMQALSPNRVRDEPLIIIGHDSTGSTAPASATTHGPSPPTPPATPTHQDGALFDRGDLLINGLYEKQTACVIDVRVTDTDQPAYRGQLPSAVLATHEKEKKKKYQERCFEQRRHFAPYVCCTSGLLGNEAKAFNKRIAALLSVKWSTPYSVTCGYVNARMSVAILRASHLCIRGSRVPFRHDATKRPQWDDGAGLGLLRTS